MVEVPVTEDAISWSEIKTFQRCPKQWEYKYDQRLVPKKKSRPLFMGSWVHSALESHYKNGDWKVGHQVYLTQWNQLFEEERLALRTRGKRVGPPLPEIVERIIGSYLWYYRNDGWKVKAVEQEFRVPTPLTVNGVTIWIKGIIDLIVEDEEGRLWVVDHKTAGTIPEATAFHAMDPQLMIYPWAAQQMWGLEVAGIYYNYVKSKAPTIPHINKDGSLSRRRVLTDYPTLYRFLKREGYDPNDFADHLRPLAKRSPFLRRYRYPREAHVTKEILKDALSVAKHIQLDKRRFRTITRDCARMCSFHDLCRSELNGMDTTMMRKMQFTLKESSSIVDRFDLEFEDDEDTEE